MEFEDYLKILASKDGSDLYLSTGAPPCAKFEGVLKPLEKITMKPGRIKDIAYELMDKKQQEEFEEELLGDVLRDMAVAEDSIGEAEGRPLERCEQFLERDDVT